jgi:hypothetical protein
MMFRFIPSRSADLPLPSLVVDRDLPRPGATSRMPATLDRIKERGSLESGFLLELGR